MSKIYSYLLQPGETYDNHICLGCDLHTQENIRQNLRNNSLKSKYPTMLVRFNKNDEETIANFLKCNQISGGLFNAVYNAYVDTKLACHLLSTLNKTGDEKFKEMKNSFQIFKSGDFNDFRKLYVSMVHPEGILPEIGGKNHSFEVNIFEEEITDIFLQRSINNLIAARNPFAVKIFSDSKNLPSYQDSFGHRIEAPHDYISVNFNSTINNENLL